ncbi:MAG: bifunctional folylpolyglutamate synthase/dihydrofolate synthase [Flavobacteriales bacterium]
MNTEQQYLDCVAWLFAKFPAYQQLGASAYKPGLERVHLLLEKLDIEPQKIPSIHIAGTNGKGSTAAYCASILTEKKYKVGLFTSPHIFDFSERIRINGQAISREFVIQFCQTIQVKLPDLDASFFELTFAMALAYFEAHFCDFMVIETGLGGRLDATNIIEPRLSLITNISLDHQEFLGDTLPQIAAEKAGIIKPNTPVVIGEKNKVTSPIFEQIAQNQGAPIYFTEAYAIDEQLLNGVKGYPKQNLKNALVGLTLLGEKFTTQLIEIALENLSKNTGHFGRLQLVQMQPKVLVDVSHNVAGIEATLSMIEEQLSGKLYIIYGAAKDKNSAEILSLFPEHAKIAACTFQNPRSKTLNDWKNLGISTIFDDINVAKASILEQMQAADLLWITGSFFLIADLKQE